MSESSTPETKSQNDPQESQNATPQESHTQQVNLLTVSIDNENTALNVLVGFLGLAQKRGAFALNEAAKIHECILAFQKNQ